MLTQPKRAHSTALTLSGLQNQVLDLKVRARRKRSARLHGCALTGCASAGLPSPQMMALGSTACCFWRSLSVETYTSLSSASWRRCFADEVSMAQGQLQRSVCGPVITEPGAYHEDVRVVRDLLVTTETILQTILRGVDHDKTALLSVAHST